MDLSTVAARLRLGDGSTTLRFYAQFVRSADQHAAALLSNGLADLRKKERLRELLAVHQVTGGGADLTVLAEKLADS